MEGLYPGNLEQGRPTKVVRLVRGITELDGVATLRKLPPDPVFNEFDSCRARHV